MGRPRIAPPASLRFAPVAVRFWAKVRKGPKCWEWDASMYPSGYGQFRVGAQGEGMAHRWAWILTHGGIPKGLAVLHRCDNRRCVRPKHLFLGTQLTNMQDAAAKDRIPRGEQRAHTKLSVEEVRQIRALYWIGKSQGVRYRDLADLFNISHGTVWKIIKRLKWRHVA